MIVLKNLNDIENLRKSGRLVGECLSLLSKEAKPGVTTLYLDSLAEQFAYDHGARPAFKGYLGFKHSICASPNSVVIHGIPSNEPLQEGDILSIDYGIELNGYYGDSAITIPIGNISKEAELIINTGQKSLYSGIKNAIVGNHLRQISGAIQSCVEDAGYNIVRQYTGHGIGKNLHESPPVLNYVTPNYSGLCLKPGLVLAIEPMITEAGPTDLHHDEDGWTVRTLMDQLAVHWEHTIVITDKEAEILTLRKEETWN